MTTRCWRCSRLALGPFSARARAVLLMTEAEARPALKGFLAALLGMCALIGGVNYLVNPLGYYPLRLLPSLRWSSRAAKLELICAVKPKVLVLGSSRTMRLVPASV